jgi:4a-hydroxytetrahydrobiopterin dehydratase
MELTQQKCVPCEGDTPRLDAAEADALLSELPGWRLADAHKRLVRCFSFVDFRAAMSFVDRMAALAEAEGHHPDFCVRYSVVDVSLYTHAIGGLSRNDFILAAKIGKIGALVP